MGVELFIKIASQVVGGLGVFLLGMKFMSEGLQAVSGDRLRKMIAAVTNNRLMGVVVGLLVTCLVQSSSVTTVMVVGFVNSGIMTLMQAIGVIMGANIGTTITGWILVLKIGKYGLPMLGIAAFFFLFSKRDRVRYIGMAIMGVGMVFFGLELMKNGFKPLRSHDEFQAWFHAFQATSYLGIIKCAMVGCILTMVVQSSSATLGITIGLASTGVIEFQTAAALVLGENIGTTITAWLASLGTTTTAKRAAYAHVLFNVLGTMWFIALFPMVIPVVSKVVASMAGGNPLLVSIDGMAEKDFAQIITAGIATVHTSFNVANVILFLPFTRVLGFVVTKLVPDKKTKEIQHLTYLDVRMLDTPSLGMVQSQKQISFMAESVEEMMANLKLCLEDGTTTAGPEREIFRREQVLDNVQKEIFLYLSNLVSGQVPHDVTTQAHMQMRLADEYESLSDYIVNVLKARKKLQDNDMKLDDQARKRLLALHERVTAYIAKVSAYVADESMDALPKAQSEGAAITELMKSSRREHLNRLQNEEVSPFFSLIYTDMLNYYRRMKDHALNIAEVVVGEK
ncbi:MAG: Na/Pi cotransporter family protein [Kiritimatiellae bacterium]|nr:Na/Pi cotransporter family protein [Kiritimatiellia bacterium]